MAASATQIPAPRVPFLDPQTNMVSPQWFLWFNNLYTFTGSGVGIVQIGNGGTGLGTTPSNGQLLIGNGTGYSLNTLFAGTGISIANGSGAISIANSGVLSIVAGTGISVSSATGNVTVTSAAVTSVSGTGTVNGITLTGTVTSAGSLTLGGTLSGVSLTSQVSGILPIANGGTGTSTAGVTATIATAKLTEVGSDGSMTFTNGLLTAQTAAT